MVPKQGWPESAQNDQARISVLIADGFPLYSQALAMALWWWTDFEVLTNRPATGFQAMKAVISKQPDVAVIDLHIPEMKATAVAAIVSARSGQTKVLVTANDPGAADIEEILQAGAAGIITKTSTVEQVGDAIKRAHSGESPVNAVELNEAVTASRRSQKRKTELLKVMARLSPREIELLRLLGEGRSAPQIAEELGIARETVTDHFHNVIRRVNATSKEEALAMARLCGLITT